MSIILLTFCSCAKNYPQLVIDKAEQYKKEGKIILLQSNDSTGKEHYIVYGDVQNQIIGIDTLGGDIKEMHLGKKKVFTPDCKVVKGEGMKIIFCDRFSDERCLSLTKEGKLLWDNSNFDLTEVYKNYYLIITESDCYEHCCKQVFFLNNDDSHYCLYSMDDDEKINKDGSVDFSIGGFITGLFDKEENYEWPESDRYYIDRYHGDFIVKGKISPKGEITTDDYVDVRGDYERGIHIPLKEFASWETLEPYVLQIMKKQEDESRIYWNCMRCGKMIFSIKEPAGWCYTFFSINPQDFHKFMPLCHFCCDGHNYQCQKCGTQVQTEQMPEPGRCADGTGHVWREL